MKNILLALGAFIVCSPSFAYFDHGERITELEKQVKELKHKFSDVNAERDVTCIAICGTKINKVNYVVSGFTVVSSGNSLHDAYSKIVEQCDAKFDNNEHYAIQAVGLKTREIDDICK